MPTNPRAATRLEDARLHPRLAAVTLILFVGLAVFAKQRSPSATAEINVAPTIVAAPATQIPLTVQIGPPEAVPAHSFVRVRGLPPSVSLTEGHAIAPGSWAVPLFALPNLRANIPAGTSGRTDFVITLLGADGTQIAEARSALVIGTPADGATCGEVRRRPARRQSAIPSACRAAASRPASSRAAAAGERRAPSACSPREKSISLAETLLRRGTSSSARWTSGLAAAALRLAATYDPAELQRAETKGIVADRNLARKWYERAREMGAPEAVERLARLNGS